jgi:biotin operon repressor
MTVIDQELERFFVSAPWVAEHFGVTPIEVYHALERGQLKGYAIRGRKGGYRVWIVDVRDLPSRWIRKTSSNSSGGNGRAG